MKVKRKRINPRQNRVLHCIVCGFPFSDRHHVYPQEMNGRKGKTLALCPNHHRLAHLLYQMIDDGFGEQAIREAAGEHFDSAFNEKLLNYLIDAYSKFLSWHCEHTGLQVLKTLISGWKLCRPPSAPSTPFVHFYDYRGPWYLMDGISELPIPEIPIRWLFRKQYLSIPEDFYLVDGIEASITEKGIEFFRSQSQATSIE